MAAMLSLVAAGMARAQDRPAEAGFRLYSVSTFSGYSTVPMTAFGPVLSELGGDGEAGGSAAFGWRRSNPRSSMSLLYSPNYFRRLRYSEWSSFNQRGSFGVTRQPNTRLQYGVQTGAAVMNLAQFMFEPGSLAPLVQVPRTFDELVTAINNGLLTDAQLASILTGQALAASPAQTVLFGNRVFSATGQTSISYSATPRFTWTASASASRMEGLPGSEDERRSVLLRRAMLGSVGAGASYARSPRTQIGFRLGSARAWNPVQQTSSYTAAANWSRIVTKHLFLGADGGIGRSHIPRAGGESRWNQSWIGSGRAGAKLQSHTFVASFGRTLVDQFGLGATSTMAASGHWMLSMPGRRWNLQVSGSQQRMDVYSGRGVTGWNVMSGFTYQTSQQSSMSLMYAYMQSRRGMGSLADISRHAVRLTFSWEPQWRLL
jgi:hypothetical protein